MTRPPISAPTGTLEAPDHRGGERVDQDQVHVIRTERAGRRHEQPRQRPGHAGQRPTEGEQEPDANPEQSRDLAGEGGCPHAKPERGGPEQHERGGHEDEDRHQDEDVEVGEGDLGVAHGEPALGVRGGKAPTGVAVDGPGETLEDDEQPDGHDDGVEL